MISEEVDGCVIDVSFISLSAVFPFIHTFIRQDGFVIALVKPQFEVGKKNIGKGGIVKDKKLYPEVLKNVSEMAAQNRLMAIEHISSPILGGDGNQEFLLFLRKN
jgi:23S rRNA (cytidine1920-2'-O)/16S rRNA (cytidine1409-2'-O)-methyltransferase